MRLNLIISKEIIDAKRAQSSRLSPFLLPSLLQCASIQIIILGESNEITCWTRLDGSCRSPFYPPAGGTAHGAILSGLHIIYEINSGIRKSG